MASTLQEQSSNPKADVAAMGKQRMDEFVKTQSALLAGFQDLNRQWFDRCQAETKLFIDFSTKLATARSIADATAAYQELAQRQWDMASEDAKRMLADSEVLTRNTTQLWSSSWLGPTGLRA